MMEFIRNNTGSWFVKAIFGVIILVFVFFFGSNAMQTQRPNIVAEVNGDPILGTHFQRTLERYTEQVLRSEPQLDMATLERMGVRRDVLMSMVTRKLMVQEARRQGFQVSDEELRQEIMQIGYFQNQRGQFDPAIYRNVLDRDRISAAEFEENVREDILIDKLEASIGATLVMAEDELKDFYVYNRMEAVLEYVKVPTADFLNATTISEEEVAQWYAQRNETFRTEPRVAITALVFTPEALARNETVTEEAIEAFYETNKERLYSQEERVRARHILLKVEANATPAEAGEVLAKIQDVKAKLDDGAEFAAMAQEHSEGPTGVLGGDLGWFGRGKMAPPFEAAAFALEPGVVSDPVRTQFGYHLIQVEQKESAMIKPLDEVREDVTTRLAQEQATARLADTLDVAIDQVLTGEQFASIAEDLDVPLQTTELITRNEALTQFAMRPDAATAIFLMEDGEITDTPLILDDGFMLAQVTEKSPAVIPPLEDVFEDVKARALQDKATEEALKAATELAESMRETPEAKANAGEVITTEPFGRGELVPGLGADEALRNAAFDAALGEWLGSPFAVADGFVVIRVTKRLPPDEEKWEEEQALFRDHLIQVKREELVQSYLAHLRDTAEFAIMDPRLVEQQ